MNSPAKPIARPIPQYGQGSGVTDDDLEFMAEVIGHRSHLSDGQEVARFEQAFCDATGAEHAVAVTSCTMALELASRILGLQPGDEIITTALTFQATVAAYVGSDVRVKFADIDPDTLCLDADSVASLITPRTKAIITVHYGGLCGDIVRLRHLADEFGLWLIEDCAHALGASVDGQSAGTWGDIGCWSFHSLKNISTLGQGGMLTVSDATVADRLRRLRTIEPDAEFVPRAAPVTFGDFAHPTNPHRVTHEKNTYSHDCTSIRSPGLNAQMSDPAAAVGRSQLARLPALTARRQHLAALLDEQLAETTSVQVLGTPAGHIHARHLYTFRLIDPRVDRDTLVSHLQREGIEVVLRYFPVHLLPEWRSAGAQFGDAPVTEKIWFRELVNLPISPQLTDEDTTYMGSVVNEQIERLANGR